jgi:Bacterial Ig-like domain (group 3)
VGNGTVTSTFLLVDGTHTYSASYTGDTNYAASNSATQTLTVARTPSVLALTITPVSTNGSGGLQLSAKLTTTGSGMPTGTVTFTNGATSLGTVNLSTAVNGVITFTTPSTVFTNYTFTAAYSGDGLFSSSSANANEGADFVAVAPAAGLSVPEGGQAIVTVSVAPINGYTGTITASCSNLPIDTVCRFLPIPVVISSTTAATLTVQIFAGVNSNVASLAPERSGSEGYAWIAFLFFFPVVLSWRRHRNGVQANRLPTLFALAFFAIVTAGLTGCGGKTPANVPGTFTTPAGTTTITLTLTDANNVSRSAPLPLTITQ